MEKTGKRGKIPQSDWPLIMARYEQGETLSSIARTYDCSPPAISYIVSRNKEKMATSVGPISAPEAILVKADNHAAASDGLDAIEPTAVPVSPATMVDHGLIADHQPAVVAATPKPPDAGGANHDQRRTLHLALGHGGGGKPNGNGSAASHNGRGDGNGNGHAASAAERPSFAAPRPPQPQPMSNGNGHRPLQPPRNPPPFDAGREGRDLFAAPEARPAAQQPRDVETQRKDNGSFIDQQLRDRVDGDISAFLAAFDAALAADTQESRFSLREATDRLLRAGARTRIELERLEARVPLPPRDGTANTQPAAWRYR